MQLSMKTARLGTVAKHLDCQYASLGAKPLQRAFSLVPLLLRCCYILSFRSDCQLVYATVRVH